MGRGRENGSLNCGKRVLFEVVVCREDFGRRSGGDVDELQVAPGDRGRPLEATGLCGGMPHNQGASEGGRIFRWDEKVADGLREEGGGLSSRASWLAGMARGVSHRQWNWQFFDFDKMRCGFL